ncbi:unnamed protein product [Allacma fusca]|uniref:Uncharacterized protein n=1 Tax=Allacma fusca TaxID=39272 RepID=A0A8J2J663_9HEXA|nr:unnamed protein product [Allacma fusca]
MEELSAGEETDSSDIISPPSLLERDTNSDGPPVLSIDTIPDIGGQENSRTLAVTTDPAGEIDCHLISEIGQHIDPPRTNPSVSPVPMGKQASPNSPLASPSSPIDPSSVDIHALAVKFFAGVYDFNLDDCDRKATEFCD